MALESTYRFTNLLGRGVLRGLGVRLNVAGAENLPSSGPVVVAANHVSYLDFLMLGSAALNRNRHLRFLIRYDAWRPPIGWALTNMRHIPVNRSAPAAAYSVARQALREGEAVALFPEAGISYSFTVRALMRGAAALARETGAPLVPTALWGPQRIYSVGTPEPPPDLTRGRPVDVHFGQPLRIESGTDVTGATIELGSRLSTMVEQLQLLDHHRPQSGEHAPWYPAHLGGHAATIEEARAKDVVPRSAVPPQWGPGSQAT